MTTIVKPKLASPRGAFSVGISRKLALLVGTVVAAVLLVGGASLALAARIQRHNDDVSREYDVILSLDRVHSAFDDLIFELHQVDFTGTQGREPNLTFLEAIR